jgi:lipopolysaccharide export LptBFGC system permease protein LptF
MGNTPSPFDGKRIIRESGVGVALAVVGIVSFIVLWVALGSTGMANAPRLFTSMCVPPVIIAALFGIYMVIVKRKQP